jgi:hypothetical protein
MRGLVVEEFVLGQLDKYKNCQIFVQASEVSTNKVF